MEDYTYRAGTVNKFFRDTLYVYLFQVPTTRKIDNTGEGRLLFTFVKTRAKRGVDTTTRKTNSLSFPFYSDLTSRVDTRTPV